MPSPAAPCRHLPGEACWPGLDPAPSAEPGPGSAKPPALLSRARRGSSDKQTGCECQLMKGEVSRPNEKCPANKAEGKSYCYQLLEKVEVCLNLWSTRFSKEQENRVLLLPEGSFSISPRTHTTPLFDAKCHGSISPYGITQPPTLLKAPLLHACSHPWYFPRFLLTRGLALPHQIPHRVRVGVNLRLQPLQQAHLSHQQEPRQLSQSHQRCWWLLCASCETLTMMKFGLKNDLAPNYQNNLHCNLSRPETEIILGQHRAEKAEEKSTSCVQLRGWAAEVLQLSPKNLQGVFSAPSLLRPSIPSVEQRRLSATSGQRFRLKAWCALPNKYRNAAVLL